MRLLSKALAPLVARLSQYLVGALLGLLAANASPEQILSLEQAVSVIVLFAVDALASVWGAD